MTQSVKENYFIIPNTLYILVIHEIKKHFNGIAFYSLENIHELHRPGTWTWGSLLEMQNLNHLSIIEQELTFCKICR